MEGCSMSGRLWTAFLVCWRWRWCGVSGSLTPKCATESKNWMLSLLCRAYILTGLAVMVVAVESEQQVDTESVAFKSFCNSSAAASLYCDTIGVRCEYDFTQPNPRGWITYISFGWDMNQINFPFQLPSAWSVLTKLRSIDIVAYGNGSIGALPPEWSGMNSLESLSLRGNSMGVLVLPSSWSNMTMLSNLNIFLTSNEDVQLPPAWGALTNLRSLRIQISGNGSIGALPPQWSNLIALGTLSITANSSEKIHLPATWGALTNLTRITIQITGSGSVGVLPAEWSSWKKLRWLSIVANVQGTLPSEWSGLSSLSQIELHSTGVSGVLPPSWAALSKLTEIYLHDNPRLGGTLPGEWGQLVLLRRLFLSGTNVTGTLPPEWSGLSELESLSLDNTNVVGTLPSEWSGLSQIKYMYLSETPGLYGSVPSTWRNLTSLAWLLLSGNHSGELFEKNCNCSGACPADSCVFCARPIDWVECGNGRRDTRNISELCESLAGYSEFYDSGYQFMYDSGYGGRGCLASLKSGTILSEWTHVWDYVYSGYSSGDDCCSGYDGDSQSDRFCCPRACSGGSDHSDWYPEVMASFSTVSSDIYAETCDDQNSAADDGCSTICTVERGWQCAGANRTTNAPDSCISICGDGVRASNEGCDDGNIVSQDGCSPVCLTEEGWRCREGNPDSCTEVCGDGRHVGQELCDDGNTKNGDGCSSICKLESGWTCIRFNESAYDACSTACGDGIRAGIEQCDDGNSNAGDGCSGSCKVERGWMCSNGEDGLDLCTSNCGDGVRVSVEVCDDFNRVSGDGCSSKCTVEAGWGCSGGNENGSDTCSASFCDTQKVAALQALSPLSTANVPPGPVSCPDLVAHLSRVLKNTSDEGNSGPDEVLSEMVKLKEGSSCASAVGLMSVVKQSRVHSESTDQARPPQLGGVACVCFSSVWNGNQTSSSDLCSRFASACDRLFSAVPGVSGGAEEGVCVSCVDQTCGTDQSSQTAGTVAAAVVGGAVALSAASSAIGGSSSAAGSVWPLIFLVQGTVMQSKLSNMTSRFTSFAGSLSFFNFDFGSAWDPLLSLHSPSGSLGGRRLLSQTQLEVACGEKARVLLSTLYSVLATNIGILLLVRLCSRVVWSLWRSGMNLPQVLQFPYLDIVLVLAEFQGLCDAAFASLLSPCSSIRAIGITLICTVLLPVWITVCLFLFRLSSKEMNSSLFFDETQEHHAQKRGCTSFVTRVWKQPSTGQWRHWRRSDVRVRKSGLDLEVTAAHSSLIKTGKRYLLLYGTLFDGQHGRRGLWMTPWVLLKQMAIAAFTGCFVAVPQVAPIIGVLFFEVVGVVWGQPSNDRLVNLQTFVVSMSSIISYSLALICQYFPIVRLQLEMVMLVINGITALALTVGSYYDKVKLGLQVLGGFVAFFSTEPSGRRSRSVGSLAWADMNRRERLKRGGSSAALPSVWSVAPVVGGEAGELASTGLKIKIWSGSVQNSIARRGSGAESYTGVESENEQIQSDINLNAVPQHSIRNAIEAPTQFHV